MEVGVHVGSPLRFDCDLSSAEKSDSASDETSSVIEYVAPVPAVTVAPPDPMIEHATLAPVNVYTTPAPVIELMLAPVIEYIAPSPAISYPSFFPSFSQLDEAITGLVKPQFSITADETSQVPVVVQEIPEVQLVHRIQEQSVEPIEAPLQEHVQLHTAIQIVHLPVPRIHEIPQEHLPERTAEQIVPERIEEQIGDIPVPPIVEETVDLVPVSPHERLHLRELSHHRPDEIVEAAALSVLENVLHERQRRVDHCVRVLKREKEKLRVLEVRGVVPPHELHSLRSHIQSAKDAMAHVMRDLYECNQQVKRRRL